MLRHPSRCFRLLLGLAALSALHGPAAADLRPRIVNGVFTSDYPTTGALLNGSSVDTASAWCTGTLIGCHTFLTAQHCVEGMTAGDFKVFLQHGGMFDVTAIAIAPGYDFPDADVAVLTLGADVNGISPSAINTVQDPPLGSNGVIVGFGRSGGFNDDYGLKRAGAVTTASCQSPANDSLEVCWNFDAPLGAPGSNSNTCNADSGGPLFLNLGGQEVVAGITSGGTLDSCLAGDSSYDADVYAYRNFIQTAGGADLSNLTCGDLPQVGSSRAVVTAIDGTLDSVTTTDTRSITVPSGTEMLRVALNAIDDGFSDFDLYVRRDSAPTTSVFDCARTGSNQFGVCEFSFPAPGTWYLMVARASGSGAFQLTATKLGTDCSQPANDGSACNDGEVCTTGDQCSASLCTGTPALDNTACGTGSLCVGNLVCASGVCTGTATPRGVCLDSTDPGRSSLQLRDRDPSSGDAVDWKWNKGAAVSDFGDPLSTTDYALCIYDESGGVPTLVQQHEIPAGPLWSLVSSGFRYSDRDATSDGIRKVKLKFGEAGRASISVSGKGDGVGIAALPLSQDSDVRVQLVNQAGSCWETRHNTFLFNTTEKFKAKDY